MRGTQMRVRLSGPAIIFPIICQRSSFTPTLARYALQSSSLDPMVIRRILSKSASQLQQSQGNKVGSCLMARSLRISDCKAKHVDPVHRVTCRRVAFQLAIKGLHTARPNCSGVGRQAMSPSSTSMVEVASDQVSDLLEMADGRKTRWLMMLMIQSIEIST